MLKLLLLILLVIGIAFLVYFNTTQMIARTQSIFGAIEESKLECMVVGAPGIPCLVRVNGLWVEFSSSNIPSTSMVGQLVLIKGKKNSNGTITTLCEGCEFKIIN